MINTNYSITESNKMEVRHWQKLQQQLQQKPKRWLITGVAGFIGSNLLEALLKLDQIVIGIDNFFSGHQHNIDKALRNVSPQQAKRFTFVNADINENNLPSVLDNIDYVLHQAALGSVPRSIEDPKLAHQYNVTGFLNLLMACSKGHVKRVVYASSSAVYGDSDSPIKSEDFIGKSLSPYATTKHINELYAQMADTCYNLSTVGLRYFNVFGPRQDPNGAYAAVIPKWIEAMLTNKPVYINGDGSTSRDFCYIDNVVQANILAATMPSKSTIPHIFNIALGTGTTLNQLFELIKSKIPQYKATPIYQPFRTGDIHRSIADISRAHSVMRYASLCDLTNGLDVTINWYKTKISNDQKNCP